ncbi:flagellar assembly protein FliH [Halobacillus salinarum]|uniref:Flagellar assembly protein FliH n=1 Tax=Halobacillus salinarum TaxID=2932257 RepID=A0ABY4EGC9_9BACI|nr:flagellar assembly protein FliH [Halobacillus salinarum]UOQ43055.1 flagellar assembly protein FliH [Halobacillus salinarum]
MSNSPNSHTRVIELKPIKKKSFSEAKGSQKEQQDFEREQTEMMRAQAEEQVRQAELEAEELLQRTKDQITAEKSSWEKERQSYVEQARQEGYSAGYADGKASGFEEYTGKIEQANELIAQAKLDYQSILQSSEEEMLEIAMKSSEKILNQTLKDQPEAFLEIVKKAVQEVQEQPEVIVHVHPDHYPLLQTQKEELTALIDSRSTLSLFMKADLPIHSCTIESPFGKIEAGVDSQLAEIRKRLIELSEESETNE